MHRPFCWFCHEVAHLHAVLPSQTLSPLHVLISAGPEDSSRHFMVFLCQFKGRNLTYGAKLFKTLPQSGHILKASSEGP